jgi:hypothetical protein
MGAGVGRGVGVGVGTGVGIGVGVGVGATHLTTTRVVVTCSALATPVVHVIVTSWPSRNTTVLAANPATKTHATMPIKATGVILPLPRGRLCLLPTGNRQPRLYRMLREVNQLI